MSFTIVILFLGRLCHVVDFPSLTRDTVKKVRPKSSAMSRHSDNCLGLRKSLHALTLKKGDDWVSDQLKKPMITISATAS